MNEQNQNETNAENETPVQRRQRIRAEVEKLAEGKSNSELLVMLGNAQTSIMMQKELMNVMDRRIFGSADDGSTSALDFQADPLWLKNMGTVARMAGDIDTCPLSVPAYVRRAKEQQINMQEKESMVQRLINFRDQVAAMPAPAASGNFVPGIVLGTFKQSLGNLIIWYGQWEKNRDYSSAINASMSLGKLSTIVSILQHYGSDDSNSYLRVITNTTTDISSECWDRIQAASGRIVPFEQG